MEKLLSYVLVVLIGTAGVCSLVWPNSNVTAVLCGLMFCIGVFLMIVCMNRIMKNDEKEE